MPKRKIGEVDASDEDQAEAELMIAMAAAQNAPADAEVAGLFSDGGPIHFKVRPEGPAPRQYRPGMDPGDKPLVFMYFAIKGLGQVPRLMLAEAGASYDDLAVVGSEDQAAVCNWRERSPNGLLPTLSGLGAPRSAPMSQSGSVVRFLGGRLGMAGQSEHEGVAADMMMETAKDLLGHKQLVASMPAKGDKDGGSKGPWALALRLEKMLEAAPSPDDGTAAMTYGQVQLLHALMSCEVLAPGCVKHMSEALSSFQAAMLGRPRIKAFLESKLNFPWTSNELGKKEGGYKYEGGPLVRGDIK